MTGVTKKLSQVRKSFAKKSNPVWRSLLIFSDQLQPRPCFGLKRQFHQLYLLHTNFSMACMLTAHHPALGLGVTSRPSFLFTSNDQILITVWMVKSLLTRLFEWRLVLRVLSTDDSRCTIRNDVNSLQVQLENYFYENLIFEDS